MISEIISKIIPRMVFKIALAIVSEIISGIIMEIISGIISQAFIPIKLPNYKILARKNINKLTITPSFGPKRDVELPSEVQ